MDRETFESLTQLAETHLTTRVHSIPVLGAVHQTTEADGPGSEGTHAHASQAVEQAVLQGITDLEKAMGEAKNKLGRAFNAIRDLKDDNPTHEKLHMLLILLQQGYELCRDLEHMAKNDLKDA